ncbi:probable tetraacyldisaccharide 4'-kinase, mitochondrial [Alnus glutinosa]|uniref:probable tetraacyldisaccharide 4'-kinase, mitochondrial n=1 Tax=Alnus glutinosa TaxID=3517 RepID=UPI002D773293|nr:probable tetraacyldisaccharide 4'-kinase, mitochondrial [Alnus glutinosa]XP_062168798.1 probable tetraacyldisaccharide 4'-kinase, mitochondrial [Alnus glutinosa]
MEKLRVLVNEIAYSRDHTKLSNLQRSLIPVLSFASSLYRLALSFRHCFYHFGLFRKHRLPVPVISVGNLTWGGNGKTPMVEFIARWLSDSGISPLILTRGYAGGDEARMLERHLFGTPAKIGVGANRAAIAACCFERYGYIDPRSSCDHKLCLDKNVESQLNSEKIGAVILDDGMQHWSLQRDLEIVMVNGLMLWGNRQLLPLGPLREPLTALRRADVAVIHHSDLVSEQNLKDVELMMRDVKESLPIFYTRMTPSHFFEVANINSELPLEALSDAIILCVSAIGSANAFVNAMEKIGASYVDRLDFSDHHVFQATDVEMIIRRLGELEEKFGSQPVIVVTEKDYDRDSEILKRLHPFKVLALCSVLQILSHKGCTENGFRKLLEELLRVNLAGPNKS